MDGFTVDLEKAFDSVPQEMIWWALRKVSVEEWLIKVIQSMYVGVGEGGKGLV